MEGKISLSTGRRTIRDQISGHPMLAFLILAFLISWIGWTLSDKVDLGTANGFGVMGSAGPALAAVIVSGLLKSEPSDILDGKRWRLFWIIGFLVMAVIVVRRLWVTPEWLVVADTVYPTVAYPNFWALLVDILAAVVIAFVLSGIYSPRQGVRNHLHSLNPRRHSVRWYWWIIALGLYPLVSLLGNTISVGLGLTMPAPITTYPWSVVALDVLLAFFYLLIGGGGLEEPGWRGFILPSLQKRFSPLRSSLILAIFWALWHTPFFWWLGDLSSGVLGMIMAITVYFLLEIAPTAVLLTAIFNRTGGSLPIVILLHASINTTNSMFQPLSSLVSILWLLLGLVIMSWMWRSPQTFSPHKSDCIQ